MKILITGSQGFLARNLAKYLSKNKFSCYGIGRGNWKKKDFKRWGYRNNISGNINKKNLSKFKNFKLDYIIHLAGGASPTTNLLKSISKKKDYEKNVLSTKNILNYIVSNDIYPKFIFMSSISIFGNSNLKRLREYSKIKPISNYAKNKVLAENFCYRYFKKFKIDMLILRGSSIYGPGLNRQIIHDVCEKIYKKNNIFFGSGQEERDFIYVDDVCNFFKKVINKSFNGFGIVNLGTGKSTKIKNIINFFNKKLGDRIIPKYNKLGTKINPNRLIPDIKKMKKYNYKPKVNLYRGLNIYLKWLH